MSMETVGIGELRHKASQVIVAAENGTTYRVTNRGKDTGVVITRQSPAAPPEQRSGVRLEQIAKSGVYDQPKPAGYEQALLELFERGRDQAGWIGYR